MFTSIRNVFRNRNGTAIVLDLAGLPSWFREQEDGFREEFRQAAGENVSRILLSYARIRDQILPLRTTLLFTDDGKEGSAAVSAVLERFEAAPPVLYSGIAGDDIAGFSRDAGDICWCCETCLAEYGEVLATDYRELVGALRSGAEAIRNQVQLMAPAVAHYAARSARVAELQQTYTVLSNLSGSVQASAEEEIRASTRIASYREQIARIDADLGQIGTAPASPEMTEEAQFRQRETVQENLAQSYREYASVLLGITVRAEDLAKRRDDEIATGVLQASRDILAGSGVPESDQLFSALIDAFPVLMDLIDDGSLSMESGSERMVFSDIASFANGLQDICLCYHEMGREGNTLSVPRQETAEERRMELLREREAIIARVMEESDRILRAHILVTVTADDRLDLVEKIEEGIRKMTGRPAQIRQSDRMQMASEETGTDHRSPPALPQTSM